MVKVELLSVPIDPSSPGAVHERSMLPVPAPRTAVKSVTPFGAAKSQLVLFPRSTEFWAMTSPPSEALEFWTSTKETCVPTGTTSPHVDPTVDDFKTVWNGEFPVTLKLLMVKVEPA